LLLRPSLNRERRQDRVPAGTHGPLRAKSAKTCTAGKQVKPETTRPCLRSGFNGFLRALPGDEFLLPPSLRELTAIIDPVGSIIASAKLDRSNDGQNHATSPYGASAVRLARR